MKKQIMTCWILISLSWVAMVKAQAFEGYTLYNTMQSTTARLVDMNGTLVKYWQCTHAPSASMPYLILPDSIILRAQSVWNPSMNGAGAGGNIQLIDWSGTVIWDYIFSDQNHLQHHDIQPMPNGNVLLIAWDRKTQAQAIAMGRVNIYGYMWSEMIVEVDPSNDSIIWEWHLWDHLIQDTDPLKPNYGVISEHPELLDINLGNVGGGDWIHANGIDYNEHLDQIVFSSHNMSEIYVIDHSTTTEEAAGHTGGQSSMGGDILYRWGNPQNYDRGTTSDRHIYVVHGVNWIDTDCPGAGHIILFNNGNRPGNTNDYSSVEEIVPPLSGYNYYIHPDSVFGPDAPVWIYSNPPTFYSDHLSGAFRLPNGNTFICDGTGGYLFEVTSSGQVVWTFNCGNQTANAKKYSFDIPGIENNPSVVRANGALLRIFPNPFCHSTAITYNVPVAGNVTLTIHDIAGRVVKTLVHEYKQPGMYNVRFDAKGISAGIYFVTLANAAETDQHQGTKTLVFIP